MASNPMHQFEVYRLGPEINLGPANLSFKNIVEYAFIENPIAKPFLCLFINQSKSVLPPNKEIL